MKYKDEEVGIPTMEMIEEYITESGYKLDAKTIYERYEKKSWKTNKGKDIISLEAIVDSMNGVFNKGKGNKGKKLVVSSERKRMTKRQLQRLAYIHDRSVSKLEDKLIDDIKNKGFKDIGWIIRTMVENIEKVNYYELLVAYYLIRKDIDFVRQAPFYINGKLYFADFYLPSRNTIVEVDGHYHAEIMQILRDDEREKNFKSVGIDTIRIFNELVFSDEELDKFSLI